MFASQHKKKKCNPLLLIVRMGINGTLLSVNLICIVFENTDKGKIFFVNLLGTYKSNDFFRYLITRFHIKIIFKNKLYIYIYLYEDDA